MNAVPRAGRPQHLAETPFQWLRPLSLWLVLLWAVGIAGCSSVSPGVTGTWHGTVDVRVGVGRLTHRTGLRVKPGRVLPLLFHLQQKPDGTLAGTLDSPDQGTTGVPIEIGTLRNGVIQFQARTIFAHYEGHVRRDGQEIAGHWTEGIDPIRFPLTLRR